MADKQKFMSDDADRFQLRLPPGFRDGIAGLARRSGRSMNAEIVHILQQFLDVGAPAKPRRIGDDEASAISIMANLEPDARKRIIAYLVARFPD